MPLLVATGFFYESENKTAQQLDPMVQGIFSYPNLQHEHRELFPQSPVAKQVRLTKKFYSQNKQKAIKI